MIINIFLDNKKSWFCKKSVNLRNKIIFLGHKCSICYDYQKIPHNSDITFFLSCEKYIGREIRDKSKHSIVIHASDLPKGKGMSPTTWQIIEKKNKIPVTLFEISDGFDEGDYYLKDSFELNGTELMDEWQNKLYECIEKMAIDFIKGVDKLKPIKQTGQASIYKRRTQVDSELDINKSIKSQFNLLRVVDNEKYPAFFKYKNCKYILKIYKEKKDLI